MNAIEIQGLEKRYPGFDLKLDLALPQGCILGLVGENGAGKSTTIKAILGMLRPDAGTIRVLGQDNSRAFAPVRERIGVVLDEPGFPSLLNAKEIREGNWVLVSLKAFDTEETLKVTLKDGERFTVRVTDAQEIAATDALNVNKGYLISYNDGERHSDSLLSVLLQRQLVALRRLQEPLHRKREV